MNKCIYCNHIIADDTIVPAIDDDAGWAQLAKEHAPDCEWVQTRAHRVFADVGKATEKHNV